MSQFIKLSFNLDPKDPLPPAIPPIHVERLFDIGNGDVAKDTSFDLPITQARM